MTQLDALDLSLDGRAEARPDLRVAVVHDYLTQRGGAERVVLALMDAFPGARLITSVYNPEDTYPEFRRYEVETTWLDSLPGFRNDPRRAIALLPFAFASTVVRDVDLVICSTSGWSHGVRTSAPKMVYCHNPARWLYQRDEYVLDQGPIARGALRLLAPALRRWDRRAAASAEAYISNSRAVAGRIRQRYARESQVVPPPVLMDPTHSRTPVPGVEPGFLLTVSRSRGYKNIDAVCDAMASLPGERLVVVGPMNSTSAPPDRVTNLSGVSDAELRWLYANCGAVVSASYEDFGLTPVEGYSFGKPAICLRAGGFLDSMQEGVTGLFIDELSAEAVTHAVRRLRAAQFDAGRIRAHGSNFSAQAFRRRIQFEADAAIRPATALL